MENNFSFGLVFFVCDTADSSFPRPCITIQPNGISRRVCLHWIAFPNCFVHNFASNSSRSFSWKLHLRWRFFSDFVVRCVFNQAFVALKPLSDLGLFYFSRDSFGFGKMEPALCSSH